MDSVNTEPTEAPDIVAPTTIPPETPEVPRRVKIHAKLAERVNLADFQNAVPFARELRVENETDAAVKDLCLTASSEPAFFREKTWHIDRIETDQDASLGALDMKLDGALLGRLTESEKATVTFRLTAGADSPVELATHEVVVELLPRNHWGGLGAMPEMVAAFVQPNEPAVENILKDASKILREAGKPDAIEGYKAGGPSRAWEIASAIWSAIGGMGLTYALPPASFEETGQKVRSPAQIAESRLATCLDSSLFVCAVLEQAGLNPILVFTRGHVFAGVWLKDDSFTSVVDDVTALRKRVILGEIQVFETTLLARQPLSPFSYAIERGNEKISEAQQDNFELVVDIRRARLHRVKPLASERAYERLDSGMPLDETAHIGLDIAPSRLSDEVLIDDPLPTTRPDERPEDRLTRWQRKLLDLSLRNNLLSFRGGKKSLKLDAPDPGALEDLLASGAPIKLLSRPDLMDGGDPRDQAIHEARERENAQKGHAIDALRRKEVFVGLPEDELDARLVELYRSSRNTLQESGSNTLYVAIGFLTWIREAKDEKRYRAPLILIPVSLERRSARSGFTLKLHDDEPRFNPTLLEMLRQDFDLDLGFRETELPKDDSGLDVAGIWRKVSAAVKDIKGWEVAEEVALSSFSFAKYLMWKDLTARVEQLRKNAVVRHLIDTPRDGYASTVDFPEARSLDVDLPAKDMFCPLPADSSQLSAIVAAARGKDFVLVGPPGTGKSQTISNLIVQCLAERKRVLFVSEKMAALDVVYRRLAEVGLGNFCLELHSNKARKVDVLEQLRTSWDAAAVQTGADWEREASRLEGARAQLNGYVERLHHRHANGLSVYEAIGRIVSVSGAQNVELSFPAAQSHDAEALDRLRSAADLLDVNAQAIGHAAIHGHPLAHVAQTEWSPNWQATLLDSARGIAPMVSGLEAAAESLRAAIGLPTLDLTAQVRHGLRALATALPAASGRDWRFALRPDAKSIIDDLQNGVRLVERHRELNASLSMPLAAQVLDEVRQGVDLMSRYGDLVGRSASMSPDALRTRLEAVVGLVRRRTEVAGKLTLAYKDDISASSVEQMQADWKKAERSLWPFGAMRRRALAKKLKALASGVAKEPEIGPDIERLVELERIRAEIAAQEDLWRGLRSLVDAVAPVIAFYGDLSAALGGLATTPESFVAIKAPIALLLGDSNVLLDPAGPIAAAGRAYTDALTAFDAAVTAFASASGLQESDHATLAALLPSQLVGQAAAVLSTSQRLNAWCAWRKARHGAISLGLMKLVSNVEHGLIEPGCVREVFESAYCRWWVNTVVDADEILRTFVSAEHEKRIHDFRELDDQFVKLTHAFVRAKLSADLPAANSVQRGSEWGLLRYEMQKKARHLPLRELMSKASAAVMRLTPCLLMSPLSVAQYLPAETADFDVVVFDEASQITVWDAIGAMARAKQVIMVGDPKQLPPTSFFARGESADDDAAALADEELESILEECIGANLPTMRLKWHYRSRHESLIAFSNHRYYDGELVTFPSPVTNDRAVSFHHVAAGQYARGGARTNQIEAKALVADVIARLKSPGFAESGLTIGVVTFNAEQQSLIEDLFDAERRADPSIDGHFSDNRLEPLFVKNLESVQGDERDIMYFSVTYGPTVDRLLSMNFGPLNQQGGERRLNVAITRARQELRVFCSFRPEQMDLSRTQAFGVRDLKHFLQFAERGVRALGEAIAGRVGDFESPFEKAVYAALAERGWKLHSQVGVSAFRIDLGVVDPDAPGRYLAGIECDGATYHRSATARDRDKLREQVLRGLGWEIVRIWSTDWWIDARGTAEKIHQRLTALVEQQRQAGKTVEVDAGTQAQVDTEVADA